MVTRIDRRMAKLKAEGRPALVTYFMSGDPDYDTALSIMKALPKAGADIIEMGMPFSDPMADGPAIQAAGLRALKGGQTLVTTLQMASSSAPRSSTRWPMCWGRKAKRPPTRPKPSPRWSAALRKVCARPALLPPNSFPTSLPKSSSGQEPKR